VGTLRVISGPQAGRSLEIDRQLVLGREDADLAIEDPDVSRRHAAVRPVEGGVAVRDLGSLNGTFVNGQQITEEVVLTTSSTIQVGLTQIMVEPAAAAKASRRVRRPIVVALGLLLLAGVIVGAVAIATSGDDDGKKTSGARASGGIIDVPIHFTVRDQNRSLVRCQATGDVYRVAGRLVAPASGPGSAVTLYLHGVILSSQFEWHFKGVPGYDYATDMAKRGHTSVLIDRVGYGRTRPLPPTGAEACFGAQADHAHQIIGELRTGRYSLPDSSGPEPKAFKRVALAGYSIGGTIAELEAGSFGDPDAVVIVSWADEGMTDYGTPFPKIVELCSPGSPKPPGGINGYFRTLPLDKLPPLLSNKADPKVVSAMGRAAELDPCGILLTGAAWFMGVKDEARARITKPVLMIHGLYDVLFHQSGWAQAFRHFTGSPDKTRIPITDGQLVMLDQEAPRFRRELSDWLKEHGF
jgi:pimeloyl-ACP methyl ester carboxylesterase